MKSPDEIISDSANSDFRVSSLPIDATPPDTATEDETQAGDFSLLPRSYGISFVSALARNPTSLFVYWEIDWPSLFAQTAPRNRQVFLRLQNSDGAEINRIVIEPMAGNCELTVPTSNTSYRVELGYFDAENIWRSAGAADVVSTPPDSLGKPADETFATVPFHLSFQRLAELFHQTSGKDTPVVERLGRVQKKALQPLTDAEGQILRTLEASLPAGWQEEVRNPGRAVDLEKRLEEILGFGSSSPTSSLGGSRHAG